MAKSFLPYRSLVNEQALQSVIDAAKSQLARLSVQGDDMQGSVIDLADAIQQVQQGMQNSKQMRCNVCGGAGMGNDGDTWDSSDVCGACGGLGLKP